METFGILDGWYHKLCPLHRYAVTPVEAACHRWREDDYPESHRPAEVSANPPFTFHHTRLVRSVSPILPASLQTPGTAYGCSLCIPFRKDHEKAEFEVHEVYAVDVLVSSGEGKVRSLQSEQRERTVFVPGAPEQM